MQYTRLVVPISLYGHRSHVVLYTLTIFKKITEWWKQQERKKKSTWPKKKRGKDVWKCVIHKHFRIHKPHAYISTWIHMQSLILIGQPDRQMNKHIHPTDLDTDREREKEFVCLCMVCLTFNRCAFDDSFHFDCTHESFIHTLSPIQYRLLWPHTAVCMHSHSAMQSAQHSTCYYMFLVFLLSLPLDSCDCCKW